jgi:hypothetical protein
MTTLPCWPEPEGGVAPSESQLRRTFQLPEDPKLPILKVFFGSARQLAGAAGGRKVNHLGHFPLAPGTPIARPEPGFRVAQLTDARVIAEAT